MKKIISKAVSKVKAAASFVCDKAKTFIIAVAALFGTSMQALAQTLAGTGYDAGTNALEEVATELVKYVPYVVNLCYALAGVVALSEPASSSLRQPMPFLSSSVSEADSHGL